MVAKTSVGRAKAFAGMLSGLLEEGLGRCWADVVRLISEGLHFNDL